MTTVTMATIRTHIDPRRPCPYSGPRRAATRSRRGLHHAGLSPDPTATPIMFVQNGGVSFQGPGDGAGGLGRCCWRTTTACSTRPRSMRYPARSWLLAGEWGSRAAPASTRRLARSLAGSRVWHPHRSWTTVRVPCRPDPAITSTTKSVSTRVYVSPCARRSPTTAELIRADPIRAARTATRFRLAERVTRIELRWPVGTGHAKLLAAG